MTRRTFQRGYVSDPIRTRDGIVFKIRWRERTPDGRWKHHSETLRNLDGKKEAREVLRQRLDMDSAQVPEAAAETIRGQDSAGTPDETGPILRLGDPIPMPVTASLVLRTLQPVGMPATSLVTFPGAESAEAAPAHALTLRQLVEGYWKPYLHRKNRKPSTVSNYQSALENHVFPSLGNLPLGEITPLAIERLVRKKEAEGLSPKSIRNILVILHGIYQIALDNDLVTKCPIKKSHKPECPRIEKPIWSADELRLILETIPAEHRCLFTCIALTGIRIGELLALQWRHIDFEARTIRIAQSLWRYRVVAPKTPDSLRILPFGGVLGNLLAEHKRVASHLRPEDFVFCKRNGQPFTQELLRRDVLYPTLDRLQIPRPKRGAGFHAFRHSAASLINSETGNLKLAQTFLGHADLSMTADTYTHVSNVAERKASEVLERAIFGNSGNLFPICSQSVPDSGTIGNRKLHLVKKQE